MVTAPLWLVVPCGPRQSPRCCMESVCKAELGWWLVPLSARLETRTEESMELAFCLMVTSKPQGVVKAMPWMVT